MSRIMMIGYRVLSFVVLTLCLESAHAQAASERNYQGILARQFQSSVDAFHVEARAVQSDSSRIWIDISRDGKKLSRITAMLDHGNVTYISIDQPSWSGPLTAKQGDCFQAQTPRPLTFCLSPCELKLDIAAEPGAPDYSLRLHSQCQSGG